MDDELAELIRAGNLCRNAGMMHAAFILGKVGAEAIRSKRKPRKKGVWVKLLGGGKAFLDKAKVDEAEKRED